MENSTSTKASDSLLIALSLVVVIGAVGLV